MEDNVAIKIDNVKKDFYRPHEKSSRSLKTSIVNIWRKKDKGKDTQHALRGVSFEVQKGEFFGIVGRNGSGKSTLLKMIAGIYQPTSGTITTNGKLVPFIELGVGFNPELTGRENIYLNGALLGFSVKEIDAMYEDIVDFSELHEFMEQKLKNYSSGMQVRLAFAVAIKAQGDVLILDEVLAVGDEAFQRKCNEYFVRLKKEKKTVILVTHSMDAVQQFCTKAVMVENGLVVASGDPAKVAQEYRELFVPSFLDSKKKNTGPKVGADQPIDIFVRLDRKDSTIELDIEITPKIDAPDAVVTLLLDRDTGEQVYRFALDEKTGKTLDLKKGKMVKISLAIQDIFPNGAFSLRASIKNRDRTQEYATYGNLAGFEIDRRSKKGASQWDIHWRPDEKFSIGG